MATGSSFLASLRTGVRAALVLGAATALVSCGGGSGNGGGPPQVRAINLVYGGSTAYDVTIAGASAGTDLSFGQATSLTTVATGAVSVVFEPTGTTTAASTTTLTASDDYDYTVLGLAGASSTTSTSTSAGLSPIVVSQNNAAPPSGEVNVVLVQADPNQGALDVFISGPSSTLPSSPTVSALTYNGSGSTPNSAQLQFAGGDYEIRATAAGDTTRKIVFDSGTVTLAAGTSVMLIVVPTSGSAATFALLAAPLSGSVYSIADQRVQLRSGNFTPSTGSVDFFLDPTGTANSSTTLLASAQAFGSLGQYATVYPGSYHASIATTGALTEIVGADLALAAGTSVSLYATGVQGDVSPYLLRLLAVTDDLTAPPTGQAKLRAVQLAPDLVTGTGNGYDLVALTSTGTIAQRIAVNLTYPAASAYVTLPPGTYALAVVATGADAPLLPNSTGVSLSLSAGDVYTAVVYGCQSPGAGVCAGGTTAVSIVTQQDP
ncbi:MAG TPA: DUF4397 domain-containing protein [Burkholderiaceae bacterium]|nr:DUF4397 domain-containing protein [Burkholderiaceae bacterium]